MRRRGCAPTTPPDWGPWRRPQTPRRPDVPEIGDELVAARALSDLAHQLLHAAAEDIEAVIGTSTAGQPAASWVDPAR
ncbi:dsRBD fold-containing protein [Embleya sp. NPDC001921]